MIGITELIGEVVKATSERNGQEIRYVFGNTEYIKEQLDMISHDGSILKLPMIALFCPIVEQRGLLDCDSLVHINLIIACSTTHELSNEEREQASFKDVLRPIYNDFLATLMSDERFYFGYQKTIRHKYSENYSYGRYGAYTANDEAVSEPIDAIDIRDMEIKIKELNTCRK